MARGNQRFQAPVNVRGEVMQRRIEEDLNAYTPAFAGIGNFLREKKTGIIHPWNEAMAKRGDLVEVVHPEDELEAERILAQHAKARDDFRIAPPGAKL